MFRQGYEVKHSSQTSSEKVKMYEYSNNLREQVLFSVRYFVRWIEVEIVHGEHIANEFQRLFCTSYGLGASLYDVDLFFGIEATISGDQT